MNQHFLAFGIACIQLLFHFDARANPSYDSISKCFWVYAPIHELAKDLRLQDLQFFTQGRIGWFTGFIQANKGNQLFNNAFNFQLEERKTAGLKMKEELRYAIQSGNNMSYQKIILKAIDCDKLLEIPTLSIPEIGK